MGGDFISLQCKSCGAKLYEKNGELECVYCGSYYAFKSFKEKQPDVYSLCPVCRKDIPVRKVTGIIRQKSAPAQRKSSLLHDLARPEKPESKECVYESDAWVGIFRKIGFGFLFFCGFGLLLMWMASVPPFFKILFFVMMGALAIFSFYQSSKQAKIINQHNDEMHEIIRLENIDNTRRWMYMNIRYEKLYYCFQDDIVFIPQEEGYMNPEAMEVFLAKGFVERKE